jgi:hypothetical protein
VPAPYIPIVKDAIIDVLETMVARRVSLKVKKAKL